jgi:hypothetical protein
MLKKNPGERSKIPEIVQFLSDKHIFMQKKEKGKEEIVSSERELIDNVPID